MRVERKQWAIALRSKRDAKSDLVWAGWHDVVRARRKYDGEAGIPLLFANRHDATAFAREQNLAQPLWATRDGYRFAVVRVRLIVEPIV